MSNANEYYGFDVNQPARRPVVQVKEEFGIVYTPDSVGDALGTEFKGTDPLVRVQESSDGYTLSLKRNPIYEDEMSDPEVDATDHNAGYMEVRPDRYVPCFDNSPYLSDDRAEAKAVLESCPATPVAFYKSSKANCIGAAVRTQSGTIKYFLLVPDEESKNYCIKTKHLKQLLPMMPVPDSNDMFLPLPQQVQTLVNYVTTSEERAATNTSARGRRSAVPRVRLTSTEATISEVLGGNFIVPCDTH